MAEEPSTDSVAMTVRAELRKLVIPLREQQAEIDRRLVLLNRERSDLLEARRGITKTINGLEPKQVKVGGAAGLADIQRRKKAENIERYILAHKEELAEGFTSGALARRMNDDGITPVASPDMVRKIVTDLHARGIVRSDRIVKGGGMQYLIVGRD